MAPADGARLAWTSGEAASGSAAIWKGTTLVRSWTITKALAGAVTWNGRTAAGAAVADGHYAFRVEVRDAAGNRTVTSSAVVVDRTAGFLRWSGPFFPQDGDRLAPTSKVSFTLVRTATTTLGIYDAAGTLVRTAWTKKAQAAGGARLDVGREARRRRVGAPGHPTPPAWWPPPRWAPRR